MGEWMKKRFHKHTHALTNACIYMHAYMFTSWDIIQSCVKGNSAICNNIIEPREHTNNSHRETLKSCNNYIYNIFKNKSNPNSWKQYNNRDGQQLRKWSMERMINVYKVLGK